MQQKKTKLYQLIERIIKEESTNPSRLGRKYEQEGYEYLGTYRRRQLTPLFKNGIDYKTVAVANFMNDVYVEKSKLEAARKLM